MSEYLTIGNEVVESYNWRKHMKDLLLIILGTCVFIALMFGIVFSIVTATSNRELREWKDNKAEITLGGQLINLEDIESQTNDRNYMELNMKDGTYLKSSLYVITYKKPVEKKK